MFLVCNDSKCHFCHGEIFMGGGKENVVLRKIQNYLIKKYRIFILSPSYPVAQLSHHPFILSPSYPVAQWSHHPVIPSPSCPVAQLSRRPVVPSPSCPVAHLATPSQRRPDVLDRDFYL